MKTDKKYFKGTETLCDCGHIAISDGFTTGFGRDKENKTICFACCGENDKRQLRETGKLSGYFSGGHFTNWPGSFKLHVYSVRKSWHNFAGKDGRTDFWGMFEGKEFHGVQIGHFNECATIKIKKG